MDYMYIDPSKLTSINEQEQEETLSNLSTMLAIGLEDYIQSFDSYTYVPILIGLLPKKNDDKSVDKPKLRWRKPLKTITPSKNPNIHILATRALASILELVPRSCPIVVQYGGVPVFVDMLRDLNNENIAEELFRCLDKISIESPQELLGESGFMEVLLNSLENLRNMNSRLIKVGISIIGNLCRKLQEDHFEEVVKSIPALTSLLQGNEDEVESVCTCFAYLVDRFGNDASRMKKITSNGLVGILASRLNDSLNTKKIAIRLLASICAASAELSLEAFKEGVPSTIHGIFAPQYASFDSRGELSLTSLSDNDELLNDALYLLNSMLPPLISENVINVQVIPKHDWFWEDDFHNFNPYDPHSNAQIEEAYRRGDKEISLRIRSATYQVDLIKMQQYNKITRLMRNVRREPIPSGYIRKILIEPKMEKETSTRIFASSFKKKKTNHYPYFQSSPKEELFKKHSKIYEPCLQILGPLVQTFLSSVNVGIKEDCISIITKLLHFAETSALEKYLDKYRITRFIVRSLSNNSPVIISNALLIAHLLIDKYPGKKWKAVLLREGFVDGVNELSKSQEHISLFAKRFISNHFDKKTIGKVLIEEKYFMQFCEDLKNQTADLEKLTTIFETNAIPTMLFIKSGFAQHLLNYIITSKDTQKQERLKKLTAIFKKSPQTFLELLNLLDASLDFEEKFEIVTSKAIKGYHPDISKNFSKPLQIIAKKRESSNLKSLDVTLQIDSLASIGSIANHLSNQIGQQVDIYLEGNLLPSYLTLYEAIYKYKEPTSFNIPWTTTYTIEYDVQKPCELTKIESDDIDDSMSDLMIDFPHISKETQRVLCLLRILDVLNRRANIILNENIGPIISPSHFIHHQMTSKVIGQLQTDASLILNCQHYFPKWIEHLMKKCKFLFPYEVRRLYFYFISFGASRLLFTMNNKFPQKPSNTRIVRTHHMKHVIEREKLFEQAKNIFTKEANWKQLIDIEYTGEPGIGLGPTLHFYTLVSRELQKKELGLWIDMNSENEYVKTHDGLFPALLPKKGKEKVLEYFLLIGRFIGKALEDNRLTDMQFSVQFLKLVLGKSLTISDYKHIDPFVYKFLKDLIELGNEKKQCKDEETIRKKIDSLMLDFEYNGHELIENGASIPLTFDNIDIYIQKLTKLLLEDGIKEQIKAFLKGMNEVFDISKLAMFTEEEISRMICGEEEEWTLELLKNSTHCTHGYSHESRQVIELFEILCELSGEEKRQFLEFVTGSSRLPVGGIKNLNPKLTIVKRSDANDDSMPTCNTCFHYLKLPPYTKKEILKEKLLYAIKNGKGFELS